MITHRSKILRTYVFAAIASVILILAGDAFGDLDIQSISFTEGKYWWDGTLEVNPFGMWVGVNGEGITDVTMTTPYGTPIVLDYWGGGGADWGFGTPDYATLSDLRADFPTGDYVFSFNGGADSVILSHNPVQPTGFANITYPDDGAINVPLNPVITWDPCVGFGDALSLLLWDEVDNTGISTGPLDIGLTDWTPPSSLEPGHSHELEIAVFGRRLGQPYSETTANSDDFLYYDLFEHCNTIQFTTINILHLSGWVFMIPDAPDLGYSLNEDDLVYFYSFNFVPSLNTATGEWSIHMPTDLVYVNWPFYYELEPGILWFALPPEIGLWVYHFSTGEWEVLPRIIP